MGLGRRARAGPRSLGRPSRPHRPTDPPSQQPLPTRPHRPRTDHRMVRRAPQFCDPTVGIDERSADIVSKLTILEKISALGTNTGELPSVGLPKYNWWSEVRRAASAVRVRYSDRKWLLCRPRTGSRTSTTGRAHRPRTRPTSPCRSLPRARSTAGESRGLQLQSLWEIPTAAAG